MPLDDKGIPTRLDPQPIHVYFPTQEDSGFGLLLQADFSLELDRRRIASNPEALAYNSWLAEELGHLIGRNVATGLASRYPGEASVVTSLGIVGSPSGIGERLVNEAATSLRDVEFVPTVSGLARLPAEVLLLPRQCRAQSELMTFSMSRNSGPWSFRESKTTNTPVHS